MLTDCKGDPLRIPGPPVPTGSLGKKNQKKYEGRKGFSIQPVQRRFGQI
jgi:hypothetical protein